MQKCMKKKANGNVGIAKGIKDYGWSKILFDTSIEKIGCFTSSKEISKKYDTTKPKQQNSLAQAKTRESEILNNNNKIAQSNQITLLLQNRQLSKSMYQNKLLIMQIGQKQIYNDQQVQEDNDLMTRKMPSLFESSKKLSFDNYDTYHTSQVTSSTVTPTSKEQHYFPIMNQYYNFYQNKRKKQNISENEVHLFLIDYDNVYHPNKIQTDGRTTLMIKNIPNKYSIQNLLQQIDFNHKGKYDFLYLPIDLKNNCNVGYAFINFLDCKFIRKFYQDFHNKKWKKFNSQKICNIRYARIQGRMSLVHHFQESNVMNQKDIRLKPIINGNFLEKKR